MAKAKHWLNYVDSPTAVEDNSGISKTVPDMSYSIKELLEKHTTGIYPEGIEKIPLDNSLIIDELNVPDFDISQIDLLKERNDKVKTILDQQVKDAKEQKEELKIQELKDLKEKLKLQEEDSE